MASMTSRPPHITQYQGSKRALAAAIAARMPRRFGRLLEPFCGSAALSLRVSQEGRAERFWLNDLNRPLLEMLREAIERPQRLCEAYAALWKAQFQHAAGHESHFYAVRASFNAGGTLPAAMLYLLARCVKGSPRYARDGGFNQSPDRRRHGTRPETMARNIFAASRLMKGKTFFSCHDYREVLRRAGPDDLVYLDPPYQGVSRGWNRRYLAGVDYGELVNELFALKERGIDFLLSYDGSLGDKKYGRDLPPGLGCRKIMLPAGRSSQSTLLGKAEKTLEALYISESLLEKDNGLYIEESDAWHSGL